MATAELKPLCKFGDKCYRRNPQHLEQYRHPKRKQEEDEEPDGKRRKKDPKKKEKKIDDFFAGSNSKKKEESDEEADIGSDSPGNVESGAEEKEEEKEEEEEEEIEPPESPMDIKENIRQKYLVEMPPDFYDFWEFCKKQNASHPEDALKGTLGFQLVGPFDILAGKHRGVKKNSAGKRPNFLLHWRYYYDPPEFQTVIRGDDVVQFHLGYFRDDPKEEPVFVAANVAKSSCVITPRGDNLFAAVNYFIEEKLRLKEADGKLKQKFKDLSDKLKMWAQKAGYSLEVKSKRMKDREKKVVCKSFHGAGIVVPVDAETEVGYREVPETPGDLKKMFKKIAESKTEAERDGNFEPLQELITLVQFANDECDYGEGLELGMDLFSYGGETFHSTVSQLLSIAYMLLARTEFDKILTAHLKHRKHTADLSQLT